jgi:hypothetical protein
MSNNGLNSLIRVGSTGLSKATGILSVTKRTLATYYSGLRQWWNDLNEQWKGIFLESIVGAKAFDFQGHIIIDPSDYQLEQIILLQELYEIYPFDLSPISRLTKLEVLECNLAGDSLKDIGPIENLVNIKKLVFRFCAIDNLIPISHLTGLEYLNIDATNVSDLQPISTFHNLRSLSFEQTFVKDISPLSSFHNLMYLSCSHNTINNLGPLKKLHNLKELHCAATDIVSIEPILNIPSLEYLNIADTLIPASEVNLLKKENPKCTVQTKWNFQ